MFVLTFTQNVLWFVSPDPVSSSLFVPRAHLLSSLQPVEGANEFLQLLKSHKEEMKEGTRELRRKNEELERKNEELERKMEEGEEEKDRMRRCIDQLRAKLLQVQVNVWPCDSPEHTDEPDRRGGSYQPTSRSFGWINVHRHRSPPVLV